MRSRNGNSSFTFTICYLILFFSLVYPSWLMAQNTKEFLISYRYVVKDATLYNEKLHISKSMRKCDGEAYGKALFLPSFGDKDLKLTVSKDPEQFIDYIHKLGLHLRHKDTTLNSKNSSTIILTLRTSCFKVDFNDNFARIVPLK